MKMNKPLASMGWLKNSRKNNVFSEILLAVAAKPHIRAAIQRMPIPNIELCNAFIEASHTASMAASSWSGSAARPNPH